MASADRAAALAQAIPEHEWMIAAIHESAHAVAYHHFGHQIKSIKLFAGGSGAALGEVTSPAGTYSPLTKAVASLSGPTAEHKYSRRPWHELTRTVAHTDMAMAQCALARMGGFAPSLASVIGLTQSLSSAAGR